MSRLKHASMIHKKTQSTFTRSKLTYAEAAKISGLSLNTVKRILIGEGAHANSCIQLERALDDHIHRPKEATEPDVILTNDASMNAESLLIAFNKQLQLLLETDDELPSPRQIAKWRARLKSVEGNLSAIEALASTED